MSEHQVCDLCRVLGAEVAWGESVGGEPLPDHPPAEVERLERVDDDTLRCPLCGNLYERGTASQTFLDNDYDSEYVRRLRPNEYKVPGEGEAALARLRADLNGTDDVARVAAAKTIENHADYIRELVDSKFSDVRRVAVVSLDSILVRVRDITPLRAGLEAMLGDRDAFVRKRAATVLIKKGSQADIDRLLESPQPDVRLVAIERLRFQDLAVYEGRLRAMSRHPDWPEVRRLASEVLASQLLKSRRDDAIALLETSTGETLSGALKGFLAAEPERAIDLMPHVERSLRSGTAIDGAERVLVALLVDAKTRVAVLQELARVQAADIKMRIPSDVRKNLAELLADSDAQARELAWQIFTTMAERGGAIASTLPLLAKKLGCRHSAPGAIITEMIQNDINIDPLVEWLALLTYSDPEQAIALLTDLHERGQNIEAATDALRKLSDPKAKSLLTSINTPEARETGLQFENLAAGHLTVGGGRAPEWILYAENGQFFIEYLFGDHGDARPISRGRVRSILARKAYTWQETRRN